MPIRIEASGSFPNTMRFLQRLSKNDIFLLLQKYGPSGVAALSAATPTETGETAHSWSYRIEQKAGSHAIIWTNSHIENGVPIALILQYGHGTGTGGYVQGRDYINPAMRPIFDAMLAEVRKAVTK